MRLTTTAMRRDLQGVLLKGGRTSAPFAHVVQGKSINVAEIGYTQGTNIEAMLEFRMYAPEV